MMRLLALNEASLVKVSGLAEILNLADFDFLTTYLTSILSIPFGPRDVFMREATVRAAMMLIYSQSTTCEISD